MKQADVATADCSAAVAALPQSPSTWSTFPALIFSIGSVYNFEGDAKGAEKVALAGSVAGLSLSFGIVSGSHTRSAGAQVPFSFRELSSGW